MLAITCINSIVNDTILIKFIIPDFELNIKKLTHSAKSKKAKALIKKYPFNNKLRLV